MKSEKGVIKLYAMEGLFFMVLTSFAIIIFEIMILVGVPCWFIGRLVVRRKRKKRILAGATPPAAPSRLRSIIEGCISIFMSAVWFALVIFLITRFAYPFFANNPLPYAQLWIETTRHDGHSTFSTPWTNSDIAICPLKKADFTTRELAATCNAAAKYYYEKLGHKLTVEISVCPEETRPDSYYNETDKSRWSQSRSLGAIYSYCKVAQCRYDPDNKPQWVFFQVGVNADNMQPLINRLWIENENKFAAQPKKEAAASLKKLVSGDLNLPPEEVEPRKINLKSVPLWILQEISPAAPINETAPAEKAK